MIKDGVYLVFDIGGTRLRIAISLDGENLSQAVVFETPQNYQEGINLFLATAVNLTQGKTIIGVSGGIAGPLNKDKSMLINSPNIPGWIKKPLKEDLSKALNAKVFLENDAALCGLGEAIRGAGAGEQIVAFITVSTGLGGARIIDGKIDRNSQGFEPGHQIINPNGALCSGCGAPGHLEAYVSGRGIERIYHKKPYEIKNPHIWEDVAKWLAVGLNNIIVHWSPNIVVIGGSVMHSLDLELVKEQLREKLTIFSQPPLIVKAKLGDDCGLYGALEVIKQENRIYQKV